MPRDEQGTSAADGRPAAPAEVELAAYRNRLEEKLAARRAETPRGAALGAAGRPSTGSATRPPPRHATVAAVVLVATLAATAGVLAGPLLRDPPAVVEARAALALERTRTQQLADELRATMQALKAQAMALADREAREAEIESLREELRQAGEIAAMRDHFLAEAQDRVRQLQASPAQPLEPSPAAPPVAIAAAAPIPDLAAPADANLPKLMARARLLLGQGDIGGARAMLERAAASGDAVALFALAETYDPAILARWGTHGTRGDVVRAHALYRQAQSAGVAAAAERLAGLP